MFHSLIKKRTSAYKSSYKIICLLLISFFLSGCVTGQTDRAVNNIKQTATDLGSEGNCEIKEQRNNPRVVKGIKVKTVSGATEILIKGNEKLAYTSVKQSFPLGIAVYLPETGIDRKCRIAKVSDQSSISSLSALYADSEKTSVKVEILLKKNFDYEVAADNTDIKILIHDWPAEQTGRVNFSKEKEDQTQEGNIYTPVADAPGNIIKNDQQDTMTADTVKISHTPAILTGISFTTQADGSSNVSIKTSHPIKYDLLRDKEKNCLILNLINTDIPEYRQRPLITKYFRSAVNRIIPVERTPRHKTSHIVIELREAVPYRISRNDGNLLLSFDPSSIPPPEFTKAKKIGKNGVEKTGAEQTIVKQKTSKNNLDKQMPEPNSKEALYRKKTIYTGEKIRLDFFETDIKNVFRILAGVSGKNFAVDKDVTGNVTLALDKPVPWDQVLDLVLKMNRLGKVEENSIIRIATRQTLIQEQKNREAEFAARKLAISQQKSLEPLVTEYIPINYANAATDIKPHLEKILTPKRGHLSVDSRTNMIIMTDVQEKIDQAKAMIYRLDKVTPQIMIAARIVEVNKNFSRQLGIEWSMSSHDVYRDDLGGTYGFDVAMNYPVASTSSLGYTFSRITGTPFALDAKLTASEIKGDVKIVSSPRILTLDNKKAKIKQGLEYPYLERDDSGGSSVKFKNIDLLLEVTPHVTPDRRISLSVHLTKNDIAGITDGVPSLSTNEANTELLVNDGNTIVIGGITKASINNDTTGFPFLSSIPVLRSLFSSKTRSDTKNELLIFITPSIVQLEQIKN